MKTIFCLLLFGYSVCHLSSQPNCNVYLWEGDTIQYEACKLSHNFKYIYQFETRAIALLDSCISICPYYAFAYYEKAVPFLKAGNPIEWDKNINLAVKYDPITYLGTRASCRGKFFADYDGAIRDIDSLSLIINGDIGYTHDGTYHLEMYKGLCYKAKGDFQKSIEIIERFINSHPSDIGFYDFLHLGVAYQETGNHNMAIKYFLKQQEVNDIAENRFYIAKSYLHLKELSNFHISIKKAKEKIKQNQKMNNKYHVLEDEIFEQDVFKLQNDSMLK